MKHLVTFFLTIFVYNQIYAQLLPHNQPEQDACNALEICGSFYTPYSYQGIGTLNQIPNSPCGTTMNPCGEDNVVWFRLNVTTSGILVFKIVPTVTTDDYDWALLNATGVNCNDLNMSHIIRCNFNTNYPVSFGGMTGLSTSSTIISVPGGTTGQNFNRYVDVTEGEVYYLMINNFGAFGEPTAGFNLDFEGSTATFNSPPAPQLQSVISNPCTIKNSIRIKLDRIIKCNSIAANGSDFNISPFGTIVSAVGIDCGSSGSGFTDEIQINFSGNLPPGSYTLSAAEGTDGNTLLNLCDIPLTLPDQLTFIVPKLTDTLDIELCEGQLPYNWNGISINSAGLSSPYTTSSSMGCDSLTYLQVEIVDTIRSQQNITICTNQLPYTWNGITLYDGGSNVARKHFYNAAGCDSLSILNLTVTPPKEFIEVLQLCSYQLPYNWNGIIIPIGAESNADYATFHNTTPSGCDSFTHLNLIIFQIDPTDQNDETHACGFYTHKGQNYYSDILLHDTIFSINGCDSIYQHLQVYVHNNVPNVESINYNSCDSFTFRGNTYYDNIVLTDSIKSIYGCDSHVIHHQIIIENLEMELTVSHDTLVGGEGLFLDVDANIPFNVISWNPSYLFPDQKVKSQYIKPNNTEYYQVIGITENGCMDTANTTVVVVPLVPDWLMPNAFSPNGDGLNDDFKPVFYHTTGYMINYFQIFNRWGNLVYTLENSRVKGWNGKDNNGKDSDPGVYYYNIEVEFVNGQKVQKKGDVTLIR